MKALLTIITTSLFACSGVGEESLTDSLVINNEDGGVSVIHSDGGQVVYQDSMTSHDSTVRDSRVTNDACGDVLWTATATGIVDFTFNYVNGCTPANIAVNWFPTQSSFDHRLQPQGLMEGPIVQFSVLDLSRVESGQVFYLPIPPRNMGLIRTTISDVQTHKVCTSVQCTDTLPPSPGTMQFFYNETKKGSQIEVKVDGYLCCTQDGKTGYERFTYSVRGKTG